MILSIIKAEGISCKYRPEYLSIRAFRAFEKCMNSIKFSWKGGQDEDKICLY